MKWLSSLLLLLLALVLGAFVLLYERNQPTTEEAAGRAKRLFDMKAQDIRWIELDRDGTLARFEREKPAVTKGATGKGGTAKAVEAKSDEGNAADAGGGRERWRMARPVADRADGFFVDSLAGHLADLESRRVFDAASPPPPDDQMGLSPPRFRFVFDAGKGLVTLLAGREAPGTGGIFLRVEKKPGAVGPGTYLVGRELVGGLDRPVQEWRDRSLFDFVAIDLSEATIARPAGTLRFRRQGEDWRLAEPVDDEAQGSKVQDLLTSVTSLRAESFHDVSEGVSKAGLEQPAHRVQLFRRDGSRAGELLLGGPVEGNAERIYARATGRDGVVEIQKRILEELDADVESFRSRRLFSISEFDTRALELASGGEKLSFTRPQGAGEWKATSPADLKPKPQSIDQTLRSLLETEAEKIVGPAKDLPGYGLDPPAARAEVTGSGEPPKKEVVRFGKPAPGEGRIYAMKEGRPFVLTVPSSILDRLSAKAYR